MASIPTDFESLSVEDQISALKILLDCLCKKVENHSHPDPEPSDPTNHVNFCGGVLGCLDGNGDGKVDVNLLPDAGDLNLFCSSVISCLDSDGNGIIDDSLLPPSQTLTFQLIMGFLDTDGSGQIDPMFLPNQTFQLDCADVLSCLDSNGNGIIDASFLPTPASTFTFDCADVLACLDDDGDGVIDPDYLPVPCVIPSGYEILSTSTASATNDGTLDLSVDPTFPADGNAKYALLEVCITADGDTLTSIASTAGCEGNLIDHVTQVHDGDATEQCYDVWATVENGTDIQWKLITIGGAGLTQSDITIKIKTLFF